MSNKPTPGAGDVSFELYNKDGGLETVTMRPTLRATQYICRLSGGAIGAIEGCSRADFDLVTNIVKHGLSLTDNGAKDLPERVWRTGILKVAVPCIEYVTILANGGRPPEETEDAEGGPTTPNG